MATRAPPKMGYRDLHGVILEELLELLLGGRISEVPDVQTTALIGTGGRGVGSLRGRSGSAVGVGVVQGGSSHAVSEVIDGRHLEGETQRWMGVKSSMCQTNRGVFVFWIALGGGKGRIGIET